jgi:hypothetical protein
VARDPNGISAADVQALRDVGFDDSQIFGITVFVALRLAFSTVNDALGASPDHQLATSLADSVRAAIMFGRPPDVEEAGGGGNRRASPQEPVETPLFITNPEE